MLQDQLYDYLYLNNGLYYLGIFTGIVSLYGNLIGVIIAAITGGGKKLFGFTNRFWPDESKLLYGKSSPKIKFIFDYSVFLMLRHSILLMVTCIIIIIGNFDVYYKQIWFYIALGFTIFIIKFSIYDAYYSVSNMHNSIHDKNADKHT